jgi:hypothetical protein
MRLLETQSLAGQILILFVLAIPVACITWTITHEEIFKEVHEFCVERSRRCRRLYLRKFFFALTCEYCLSHYVTAVLLVITRYRLLFDSWRGYLIAGLSLVWIANFYMAIFGRLRLEIKSQKLEIAQGEAEPATIEPEDSLATRGTRIHHR